MMKRITAKFLAHDSYTKEDFVFQNTPVLEVESFEERQIAKDKDIIGEYSFDSLWEATKEFAGGIWHAIAGFGKMSMWAIVVVFEGIKWLWKEGIGKKQQKAKVENKGG